MRVIIRAFTKDNYHRDIVMMDERQVHQFDGRIDNACSRSVQSGLIGVAVEIKPSDFPEVTHFAVVIVDRQAT